MALSSSREGVAETPVHWTHRLINVAWATASILPLLPDCGSMSHAQPRRTPRILNTFASSGWDVAVIWWTRFYGSWTTRFDRPIMTLRPIKAHDFHITDCRVMTGSGGIFSILACGQRCPPRLCAMSCAAVGCNTALTHPSTPATFGGTGERTYTYGTFL